MPRTRDCLMVPQLFPSSCRASSPKPYWLTCGTFQTLPRTDRSPRTSLRLPCTSSTASSLETSCHKSFLRPSSRQACATSTCPRLLTHSRATLRRISSPSWTMIRLLPPSRLPRPLSLLRPLRRLCPGPLLQPQPQPLLLHPQLLALPQDPLTMTFSVAPHLLHLLIPASRPRCRLSPRVAASAVLARLPLLVLAHLPARVP